MVRIIDKSSFVKKEKQMKILLVAINAKYVHSNLAIYNLKAYAEERNNAADVHIALAEYTINQQLDEIIKSIYLEKPDFIAFSCYIWNIEYVKVVIREIAKILPKSVLWVGGPEVSYCAEQFLEKYVQVHGVMIGEGEETFAELVQVYENTDNLEESIEGLQNVKGIVYRKDDNIIVNEFRPIMDLSKVPFVYNNIEAFQNKIIYYESSRGCPFSCSYCLSSVDKNLRFRNTELVKKELGIFLKHQVKQVKFVDRTFNCNHKHAMEIWSYIQEHDNGITNFHFEVAADLINEKEIELLRGMRKGLVQLEIGVQSTYMDTIREIKRVMEFPQVCEVVETIQAGENIHQHLDLIAGLPYETIDIFAQSFNDVYALKPEQLQLGFLKVLKGSYMHSQVKAYGLVYQSVPPYEILCNKWISYDEILILKGIEEMVEVYYNSGQFNYTIRELEKLYENGFEMYKAISEYYDYHCLRDGKHTRIARYEILYRFIEAEIVRLGIQGMDIFYDSLMKDLYLRENIKTRPSFAKVYEVDKTLVRTFFEHEEENRQYLKGYEQYDKRQMGKMTHVEYLNQQHVLFDYKNRSPLTHEANIYILEKLIETN